MASSCWCKRATVERSKRAEGSAADESLQVPQTQGARFVIVPGEGFGVLHELLVSHASLPDALFEQRPWWPAGRFCSPPGRGGSVAF
jgi:hypothetical protein